MFFHMVLFSCRNVGANMYKFCLKPWAKWVSRSAISNHIFTFFFMKTKKTINSENLHYCIKNPLTVSGLFTLLSKSAVNAV